MEQTKAAVLAAFAAARREHEAFLDTIPRARMTEPGADGPWSVKDVIAHLAGWRERTLGRLEALVRGASPPPPPWPPQLAAASDDEINAWLYEQNRDKPLDQVLSDWRASFDRLAAALAALPEEALFDPTRVPWLEGQTLAEPAAGGLLGHFHEEHEATLRAWLAKERG